MHVIIISNNALKYEVNKGFTLNIHQIFELLRWYLWENVKLFLGKKKR